MCSQQVFLSTEFDRPYPQRRRLRGGSYEHGPPRTQVRSAANFALRRDMLELRLVALCARYGVTLMRLALGLIFV